MMTEHPLIYGLKQMPEMIIVIIGVIIFAYFVFRRFHHARIESEERWRNRKPFYFTEEELRQTELEDLQKEWRDYGAYWDDLTWREEDDRRRGRR
jgi:purine-cytosine permease-like protein